MKNKTRRIFFLLTIFLSSCVTPDFKQSQKRPKKVILNQNSHNWRLANNISVRQYAYFIADKIRKRTANLFTQKKKRGSTVIVLTDGYKVLMHKRFKRAKNGANTLASGGGSIDRGEYPLVAGMRELAEEAGFIINSNKALKQLQFYNLSKDRGNRHFYLIKGPKVLINKLMGNTQVRGSRKDKWEYQRIDSHWQAKLKNGYRLKNISRQIWLNQKNYNYLIRSKQAKRWKFYERKALRPAAKAGLIDSRFAFL